MKRFTESHEYIVATDGDSYRVGITDYARDELGDVVFLELPEVGDALDSGEPFGAIDSVKAAVQVYAPVSGEVTAVNQELVDEPEGLSASSGGDPWLVEVRVSDPAQLEGLLGEKDYQALIESDSD